MNTPARERLIWARDVADAFAKHAGVEAIIVGGSVARGDATERSDIDLGIFWTAVASPDARLAIVRELEGTLTRQVDNRLRFDADNPRGAGCIDIIGLAPTASRKMVTVDLEHETVDGTWQVLSQVVDHYDIALDKHELLHVLVHGEVLYGEELVAAWREAARGYPDALVSRMIARHFATLGTRLSGVVLAVRMGEWIQAHQGLVDAARALILTLSALNRSWIHTDNPSFKGVQRLVDGFQIAPERFYDRLGESLQSCAPGAIRAIAGLGLEVLALIPQVVPYDTSAPGGARLAAAIQEANDLDAQQ